MPDDAWKMISKEVVIFESPSKHTPNRKAAVSIALQSLYMTMMNPAERGNIITEFERSLTRTLLIDTHEAIKRYTNKTRQFSIYEAAPWYPFTKLIRNMMAHQTQEMIGPRELAKHAVTWRFRTLDKTQVGKPIIFTTGEAQCLFADHFVFVNNKLK